MKKLLFALIFGVVLSIQAQYEIKINPIMTVLGEADISAEYVVNETFGVEFSLQPFFGKSHEFTNPEDFVGKQSGMGEKLRIKYYFAPYNGGDGQYVSGFVSNLSNTMVRDYEGYIYPTLTETTYTETLKLSYVGIGFEYGFKYLLDSGLVLDYAVGFGAYVTNNSKLITDPEDVEKEGYDIKPDPPLFFSGKFSIGYRFGDY